MRDLLTLAVFVAMLFSPCLVASHIVSAADANLGVNGP